MWNQCIATALMLIAGSTAQAQWTVAYLHPAGASDSYALAGSGTIEVGYATFSGHRHACRWSGSVASWVDLNPAGSVGSEANAISGTQIGGWAWGTMAALWSGTASSAVPLNGATVYGISGAHQVGYVVVSSGGYIFHALLYSGPSAPPVDLNPGGSSQSFAYGIFGTQQVGQAGFHAGLWSGTAASWVDLGPGSANATSGTQQVGHADLAVGSHAALWSGSPESLVDLNPAAALSSSANAIFGPYQVGYVTLVAGSTSASLWRGTAASWENLSLALTGSWSNTAAQSVWSDDTRLYVAGSGHNNSTNRDEALLWSRPLPVCAADLNHDGLLSVQDVFEFLAAYFSNDPRADFNHSGAVSVQDVFDFLVAYFAAC